MNLNRFLVFAGKVTLAHVVTYLASGTIAYPLLTREFYMGPNPIFATFMRTEAEPALWSHVMTWFIPAQLLRGLLISAALYPFCDILATWSFVKRCLSIAGLYIVLGFWAAAVAAPGTIEGWVYLRPEITGYAHFKVQPEIILQGFALAAWVAGWMVQEPGKPA
ncbi:MAG TPA: hypothetical protein VGL91_11890 [Acidobacteriota bacterium]|jgi:hypothetical protein